MLTEDRYPVALDESRAWKDIAGCTCCFRYVLVLCRLILPVRRAKWHSIALCRHQGKICVTSMKSPLTEGNHLQKMLLIFFFFLLIFCARLCNCLLIFTPFSLPGMNEDLHIMNSQQRGRTTRTFGRQESMPMIHVETIPLAAVSVIRN